ncbi:MAG: hypothetical protein ACRCZO_00475 [Cetobacterium sp.]
MINIDTFNLKLKEDIIKIMTNFNDIKNLKLEELKIEKSNRYISLINEDNSKDNVKEVLIELIHQLKANNDLIFNLYLTVNMIGFFTWEDYKEISIEIFSNCDTDILLDNIIKYLHKIIKNKPYDENITMHKFKEYIRQRNYKLNIEVKNAMNILTYYLFYCENANLFRVFKELKFNIYLLLFNDFNFGLFFKELELKEESFKKLLREKDEYKYKFIVTLNEFNEEFNSKIKLILTDIFKDDLYLIAKEVFCNRILYGKQENIYHDIFIELFKNNNYKDKFLKNLDWGENFISLSKYLIKNESNNYYSYLNYYAEAFLKEYKVLNNSSNYINDKFYLCYFNLMEVENFYTLLFLFKGLLGLKETYLKFLKEFLLDMKYKYCSNEYKNILNTNNQIAELITLHLIICQDNDIDHIVDEMKDSISIVSDEILDDFITNSFYSVKSLYKELFTLLVKINSLPDDNKFKNLISPMLEKFSNTEFLLA